MAWLQLGFLSPKTSSVTGPMASLSLSLPNSYLYVRISPSLSFGPWRLWGSGCTLPAPLGVSYLSLWLCLPCPLLVCGTLAPSRSHRSF